MTGATGQQGGAVYRHLQKKGFTLRALDGVYGVFSVQPFTVGEIQQGVAVIEAAKRQGASHFVYTSVGSANEETGIPHFDSKAKVEEHLISSGLRYTVLRPVFFMENWLRMFSYWGKPIRIAKYTAKLLHT